MRGFAALAIAASCTTLGSSDAFAAGFEIGENTALANARGGTGVVSKTDPSATYFNPGRLSFAKGTQLLLDSNLVDLNLEFQRDPLVKPSSVQEFEPVRNVRAPFPVPHLATSFAVGDSLTLGVTVGGPHAYGRRCFSEVVDGECQVDFENAARHMVVDTNLLVVYFLAAAGYGLETSKGTLGFGLAAGPAYMRNSISLVVDQLGSSVGEPYTEDPNSQGVFAAKNLTAWRPVYIGGLAWEGHNGVRAGLSWRPPIHWKAEGTVEIDLPEAIEGLVELKGDGLLLETWQAGSFRLGWGYALGTHPGDENKPLFDVEANVVWENWSVVDAFITEPQASLELLGGVQEQELSPVVQPKGYQDAYSLRLGTTYGAATWASIHLGGFIETAAQKKAVTNVDFVSWERYAGSFGITLHPFDWLDFTGSFMWVLSPDRHVQNGEVYSQIPLSRCTYPDYDQEACANPGTPPGNPQNEGTWSNSFLIYGAGLTAKF